MEVAQRKTREPTKIERNRKEEVAYTFPGMVKYV
jgi:hypothetical protein